MRVKTTIAVLLGIAFALAVTAHACRVPYTSPDFDALISVEAVEAEPHRFEAFVPTEMNGAPFLAMYLKFREVDEEASQQTQRLEATSERGGLVSYFSVSNEQLLAGPYLYAYYQGSKDRCGTAARKEIVALK